MIPSIRTFLRTGLALLAGAGSLLAHATTSFSCRACHTRIYEEWAGSSHARAFDSPVFQAKYRARGRPESCLKCHSPGSVWEHGLGRVPLARKEWKEEGVNCISCHRDGIHMVGPHDTHDAAHPTLRDGAIRSVGMCGSCHDKPCECQDHGSGQVHDYLHSPQRRRETCQSCHMPEVFASSVDLVRPTYPARKGRSHRIDASREPEVLRLAVALDARVEGKFLHVWLTNEASGHMLPGGPERALVLETVFTDRNGLEFDHEIEYLMAKTNTRIRPAETRFYRYLLKPRFEGFEIRLMHRLFENQPRADWVLIDRLDHSFVDPFPVSPRPTLLPGEHEGIQPRFEEPSYRTP